MLTNTYCKLYMSNLIGLDIKTCWIISNTLPQYVMNHTANYIRWFTLHASQVACLNYYPMMLTKQQEWFKVPNLYIRGVISTSKAQCFTLTSQSTSCPVKVINFGHPTGNRLLISWFKFLDFETLVYTWSTVAMVHIYKFSVWLIFETRGQSTELYLILYR